MHFQCQNFLILSHFSECFDVPAGCYALQTSLGHDYNYGVICDLITYIFISEQISTKHYSIERPSYNKISATFHPNLMTNTWADPWFTRRRANDERGPSILSSAKFLKNWMKMKKIGPRGRMIYYVDLPQQAATKWSTKEISLHV